MKQFLILLTVWLLGTAAQAQLFVGYDGVEGSRSFFVDLTTGQNTSLPVNFEIAGAAANPAAKLLYLTDGINLYRVPYGTHFIPRLIGGFRYQNEEVAISGLAYDTQNEKLYGSHSPGNLNAPEGFYEINPASGALTPKAILPTAEANKYDFGGFDYNAGNGKFYALSDDPDARGIFEINLEANLYTPAAPYPSGQLDLDGLAAGDNKLFLVSDEPGLIYIYNLATGSYDSPINSPFTGNGLVSGAAYVPGMLEPNLITLNVTVKLASYQGSATPIDTLPVTIKLDDNSEQTVLMNGIGDIGTFMLQVEGDLPHTLKVKPRGYLSETQTIEQGVNLAVFLGGGTGLTAGDADLNQDNLIDDFDLAAIIFDFGYIGTYPTANGFSDVNGDGKTNDFDLAAVIFGFGKTGN